MEKALLLEEKENSIKIDIRSWKLKYNVTDFSELLLELFFRITTSNQKEWSIQLHIYVYIMKIHFVGETVFGKLLILGRFAGGRAYIAKSRCYSCNVNIKNYWPSKWVSYFKMTHGLLLEDSLPVTNTKQYVSFFFSYFYFLA